MSALLPPFLSRFDPAIAGEGDVDPLGTAATAGYLAERVLPHITLRMQRPRFITMIAVGAHVAAGMEEALAADGKTPAWLVFEWIVAEAFVRNEETLGDEALKGMRGRRKVQTALRERHGLSAYTYLKGARDQGYTGTYRRLAEALQIVGEELQLDEGGDALVRAWEQDQDLVGFHAGTSGVGADCREAWRKALCKCMAAGATDMSGRWAHWERIAELLRPDGAGPRERAALARRLVRTDLKQNPHDALATEMRRELVGLVRERGGMLARRSERAFLHAIRPRASEALGTRLDLIDAHEGLCRPIESAFRYALHESTRRGPGPVGIDELAASEVGKELAARIAPAVDRLAEIATEPGVEARVRPLLERYDGVRDPGALFETVLAHHEENQRRKPPEGKRPWFERLRQGPVVRQRYAERSAPPMSGYVYEYRARRVYGFLQDLGEVA